MCVFVQHTRKANKQASPGGVSQVGGWKQEPPVPAGSMACGTICAAASAAPHSSSTARSFMWKLMPAAAANSSVHTHNGKMGACGAEAQEGQG